MSDKINILWIAPTLNHYKARNLEYLSIKRSINLTVLAGSGRKKMGDQEVDFKWNFNLIRTEIPKSKFGYSIKIFRITKKFFNEFDWIMIPAESKNIFLIIFAFFLKKINPSIKLFSYNHSPLDYNSFFKIIFSRLVFLFYDKIIFYTKDSYARAIGSNIFQKHKFSWANNTLNDIEIKKYYKFSLPPVNEFGILFLGRLIPNKKIDFFIDCMITLSKKFKNISVHVIGDGPENLKIMNAKKNDLNINWYGSLVDEEKISRVMKKISVTFVPGHSGLSINHSFFYGKPYFTCNIKHHPPEISYIDNDLNGFILPFHKKDVLDFFSILISDRARLELLSKNAFDKGQRLNIKKWSEDLIKSLK